MGFGKDGKGIILWDAVTITLGTLAARDVLGADSGYTGITEDFRILKSKYYLDWSTQAVGDVILIGIADGQMTDAEIEEALEARPVENNDVPAIERAGRAVWPLAILGENSGGSGHLVFQMEENLRWTFSKAEGWRYWAWNLSTSTALTTGGIVSFIAKHFGVWVV